MAHLVNKAWFERIKPQEIAFLFLLSPFLITVSKFLIVEHQNQNLYLGFVSLIFVGTQLNLININLGRILAQLGVLIFAGFTLYQHWQRPALCLFVSVVSLILLAKVNKLGKRRIQLKKKHDLEIWNLKLRYYIVIFTAILHLATLILNLHTSFLIEEVQIFNGLMVFGVYFLAGNRFALSQRQLSLIPVFALICLLSLGQFQDYEFWSYSVLMMSSLPLLLLMLRPMRRQFGHDMTGLIERMFQRPESAVVLFFALLSLVGTLGLASHLSIPTGKNISLVDAAFTAVSAACVTGLVVLDTAKDFNFFGQICILLLIQLGGLGIMALSSVLLLFLKRRLSVSEEQALMEVMGRRSSISGALRQVLYVTFSIELIGALVLTGLFLQTGDGFLSALWRGIFTAISAFCNAGFALQNDSLIAYQSQPAILLVVSLLIIAGGLSPAFIVGLPGMIQGTRLSLQYRFVVYGNTALLFLGAILYLLLEWNASLQQLGLMDKLTNSWFQSVSSRTAGFNSTDFSILQPATSFVIMSLMFIGGSPGGTAGGIKITTFMIIAFVLLNMSRGLKQVTAFNRNISKRSIYQATTVVSCGLLIGYFGLTALLTTQRIEPLPALFEVVSASGTVGLSIGATQDLNDIGKLIIMLIMFLGRIGSLALVLFLGFQVEQGIWKYPGEDVSPV